MDAQLRKGWSPEQISGRGRREGTLSISHETIYLHVWADKPAERLVFINGRKYVQGDRIEDKVLLEEITQDGAMVSYQGRRSLLRP